MIATTFAPPPPCTAPGTVRLPSLINGLSLVMLLANFACKPLANKSQVEALGTMKASVQTVAVYQYEPQSRQFLKANSEAVTQGAKVWTVDDAAGNPRVFNAASPTHKGLSLYLVDVVYQNTGTAGWQRGLVLAHCFNWDNTQHVSASIVKGAQTSPLPGAGIPPPQKARKLCGL